MKKICGNFCLQIFRAEYLESKELEIWEEKCILSQENMQFFFWINISDYGFSQNQDGKTNQLPIRAYQDAIKNFCENRNLSVRNDESTFWGRFFNKKIRQERKIFKTAYQIFGDQDIRYIETAKIG